MYDQGVRNLRIIFVGLFVSVCLGFFAFAGVGSAAETPTGQTAQTLGAESASGDAPSSDNGDVEGEFDTSAAPDGGNAPDTDSNSPGSGATLPSADTGDTPAATKAAAAGSQGASLPFTGFLAIPALLAGMALLGAGLVVRQRTTP